MSFENTKHIQHPFDRRKTLCGNPTDVVIVTSYKDATCESCRREFGPLPKPYQSTRTHTRDDF